MHELVAHDVWLHFDATVADARDLADGQPWRKGLGIARGHRGFVTVDSKPQQGSTFRVYLPPHRAASPAQAEAAAPGKPGEKPQYHYHAKRDSIIQILSGDVTEWVEGKPVKLNPGDVIYIAPGTKHAMINNSSTEEAKYMEFFSPIAPDNVQVKD